MLHLSVALIILAAPDPSDLLCYRYADVLVHRLLAASLGLAPLPETARDRAGVHTLTDNLNTRHRNAQMAGRASVELHTLIFFKNRTVIADARITRVRDTEVTKLVRNSRAQVLKLFHIAPFLSPPCLQVRPYHAFNPLSFLTPRSLVKLAPLPPARPACPQI